jgi:Holliday junction DNA helicase RuvA
MISFIKGKILFINNNSVSIRMGDMAFEVNMPFDKFTNAINIGDDIEVYTKMIVRENDISLWGFFTMDAFRMFQELISISGVGPKTAQNLVFEIGVEEIYRAIMFEESAKLKISGIGLKTAQKIILELKSKLPNKFKFEDTGKSQQVKLPVSSAELEAAEALVALGYREKDVLDAINKLKSGEEEMGTTQDIIKKVLKLI